MTENGSDNLFWQFSLSVYDRPGVAEACLALQGRHQLDVNILLFCCWAGVHGQRFDGATAASLIAGTDAWQDEVVKPLRQIRQWLKQHPVEAAPQKASVLREGIKARELEAESVEQAILAGSFAVDTGAEGQPADAIANLHAYFAQLRREPGVADNADLAQILTAVFGARLRPLDAVWQMQGLECA